MAITETDFDKLFLCFILDYLFERKWIKESQKCYINAACMRDTARDNMLYI